MLLRRFVAPNTEKEPLFFLFVAGVVNWANKSTMV